MWKLLEGPLALLLPATCIECRHFTDDDEPLCALCARTIEPIRRACPRCSLPAPSDGTLAPKAPSAPCLGCQRDPPPWRAAIAPFVYGGAIAVAVRRWKLGPTPELSRSLGRLLAPSIGMLDGVDALVPVPLHARRLARREFNQAAELARAARSHDPESPPILDLLDRIRDTPSQSSLDGPERRRNVRGAFRLRRRTDLDGAHLCLVDDVLTTGATAAACARALLDGGATQVDVLTLARALP